jgi:hypothetical protein
MVRLMIFIGAVMAAGSAVLDAHDQFRFVGTVVRLEASKNLLTFRTREDKKDLTLKVRLTPKTTLERDGKPVPRSELKPGVAIVVDAYGDDYDDMEGLALKIVPPPAK